MTYKLIIVILMIVFLATQTHAAFMKKLIPKKHVAPLYVKGGNNDQLRFLNAGMINKRLNSWITQKQNFFEQLRPIGAGGGGDDGDVIIIGVGTNTDTDDSNETGIATGDNNGDDIDSGDDDDDDDNGDGDDENGDGEDGDDEYSDNEHGDDEDSDDGDADNNDVGEEDGDDEDGDDVDKKAAIYVVPYDADGILQIWAQDVQKPHVINQRRRPIRRDIKKVNRNAQIYFIRP